MLVPLLFSLHCVLRMPLAVCGERWGGELRKSALNAAIDIICAILLTYAAICGIIYSVEITIPGGKL